jgi:hypothetical protein
MQRLTNPKQLIYFDFGTESMFLKSNEKDFILFRHYLFIFRRLISCPNDASNITISLPTKRVNTEGICQYLYFCKLLLYIRNSVTYIYLYSLCV